jgi:hypothetical protein
MQLLYLLLKRQLFVVKLACNVILDRDELAPALRSLGLVIEAAFDRIGSLTGGHLNTGHHQTDESKF